MNENLKFKPGQVVFVQDVRSASAVGYLGTWHKVYDYIAHPEFLRHDESGTPLYPCESLQSGFFTWFYEDELSHKSEPLKVRGRATRKC